MSRLDDLYARYLARLIRDLVHFGQSEEDARDFAQEALIATWKRIDDVSEGGEWFYLKIAAHNIARKRADRANVPRHGAGLVRTPIENAGNERDDTPSVERMLIEREEILSFRARFHAALDELSDDTRQCIVLKKRGLTSREIAETLGLSDLAVRSRLSRATTLIRERVGPPPPGVDWIDLLGENDE